MRPVGQLHHRQLGPLLQRCLHATVTLTPNTTLKSDFIFSSEPLVATDVKVNLAHPDKSGLVESLDLSLTWGLFDIANGDTSDNDRR